MSNHTPKQKRNDIQGLRSIAIIGVLLFHLAPKGFINGFLGVDIFFVLSGYLMTSILSREKTINVQAVKGFYTRRFKRIVPLYAVMLVILAVLTPIVFIPSDVTQFITDMAWALPFAENMQNVFNSPVLLHTWSLGVEIQYYLIVPFIMIIARLGETRQFRMIAFFGFIAASYAIHFFSSTTISFGLLFARVWQFLTGSIFFEAEGALRSVDEKKSPTSSSKTEAGETKAGEETSRLRKYFSYNSLISLISYCVTLCLIVMVIGPISSPTLNRFLVTLITGILLLLGMFAQNGILSNEIMVYIGDISYVVYLAHWPVIILYKYYNDIYELTVPDMAFCLLLTLIISVLLHHSVESYFITASPRVAVIFVALSYAFILVAVLTGSLQQISERTHIEEINSNHPLSVNNTSNGTFNLHEAITWNRVEWQIKYIDNPDGCIDDVEVARWTGYTDDEEEPRCLSTGNGTAKVLVMGNSYAYRAFPVIHRLFAGRYSQMRMFTKFSRVFLTPEEDEKDYAKTRRVVVEKFKPDIIFIIEQDYFKDLTKPIEGKVEDDPITKYFQNAVDFLSNNSGTVVVDMQYVKPNFPDGIAYKILKRMQMGKNNFEDLRVPKKDYEVEFANEKKRMSAIKNEKAIMNRVADQLCSGNDCYFYNRDNMHAYYGDAYYHLTSEGLKQLEPKYSEIIEDFLKR